MYTKDLTVLAMECHEQGFFVVGLLSQHNASLGYHNNEIWDHCKANLKNIKIIYQLTSNIAPFLIIPPINMHLYTPTRSSTSNKFHH